MIAHFEDHTNGAVAKLASRPVKQAHSAVSHNQPIFDGHITRADMLPSGQVFAVKKLLPLTGFRLSHHI